MYIVLHNLRRIVENYIFFLLIYTSASLSECTQEETTCDMNVCVTKESWCDGVMDCPDGTDEKRDCGK